MNQLFQIRGVVEGFYGVFYTPQERHDLIRFLGEHDYNLYIYAPKNDRQHRGCWRDPYPAQAMARFQKTVEACQEAGLNFCYALSPGLSICYSSEADYEAITAKFEAFYDIGVRSFSLFLDDITPRFHYQADCDCYKSYAEAHISICNRVYEWLQTLSSDTSLSLCPTDYAGTAPFSEYLFKLGEGLNSAIDVFYTGPSVCSTTITTADAEAFAQVLRRKPLIWDNYPVNDGEMQAELHIGPIRGREADLYRVTRGFVVNPMIQAEASKVALATFADYFTDPQGYNPQRSWNKALREVAGENSYGALRVFAENSLFSCLGTMEAETLQKLNNAAVVALINGESPSASAAVATLERYLSDIDDACYHLTYEMENTALRNNLLPWIELLEFWHHAAVRSLMVLKAIERGAAYDYPLERLQAMLAAIHTHPKRIAGTVLLPLPSFALDQVKAICSPPFIEKPAV